MTSAIETARRWLAESRRVLIGAGAGLSAAAGVDYADHATFAELFPAFLKLGFTAQYQLIGHRGLTPAQHWGYWSTHVKHVRFGVDERPVYQTLRAMMLDKNAFVLTSNVDMLFARNGFDEQRLYTPQGDYARLQCTKPCSSATWPTRPVIERCLAALDPKTQEVVEADAIPRCPRCGGTVFMNVRLDGSFLEEPYVDQAHRFAHWMQHAINEPLLVVEIGAGFNTPTVVRKRMEFLVSRLTNTKLIRINPSHPEVPEALDGRALSLAMGALDALERLKVGSMQ